MARYILLKLLTTVLVLIVVSLAVFLTIRVAPGDPVTLIVGNQAPAEVRSLVRARLHLDQPLLVQYGIFVLDAVRGDFGRSYILGRTVSSLLGERLLNTVLLGVPSLVISYALAVPLGMLAAVRHRSWVDTLTLAVGNLGVAIPGFLVSLILIYLFGYVLHWLPTAGAGSIQHLVLPVVALTFGGLAITLRFVRAAILDELNADYVRVARAKGLAEPRVLWAHAFRNALLPIISLTALRLGWLLGGAVVVEVVFAWPGAGRLLVDAVTSRDYPVVQAVTLILAASVILANLAADVLYAVANPRIRY